MANQKKKKNNKKHACRSHHLVLLLFNIFLALISHRYFANLIAIEVQVSNCYLLLPPENVFQVGVVMVVGYINTKIKTCCYCALCIAFSLSFSLTLSFDCAVIRKQKLYEALRSVENASLTTRSDHNKSNGCQSPSTRSASSVKLCQRLRQKQRQRSSSGRVPFISVRGVAEKFSKQSSVTLIAGGCGRVPARPCRFVLQLSF